MKSIANLAADGPAPKKRRKGGDGQFSAVSSTRIVDCWTELTMSAICRASQMTASARRTTTGPSIARSYVPPVASPRSHPPLPDPFFYLEQGTGNDSEEEEDDLALLSTLETRLLSFDPLFTPAQTFAARSQQQAQLLTAFLRGSDVYNPESLEQSYQLHLNVERSRVPEVWFQPSMAGLDSAGVGEIVEHVLRERTSEERGRMQQVRSRSHSPGLWGLG